MTAYYNEIDPYAAQWLRNLIAAGLIAPGDVDERSIVDVPAADLAGYEQCHFFAGIGGWSYALRIAGWPDDRPVWTGSCPCQPLSSAGQRKGHADARHLWPAFHILIAERKPSEVFGEQVASKDGREWLAAVRADLEGTGYAVGAADLCAAGAGAPHIRQRLFWVANAGDGAIAERARQARRQARERPSIGTVGRDDSAGKLGDADGGGRVSGSLAGVRGSEESAGPRDAESERRGFWDDLEWLPCADGKWRPTQSGLFPLAHGVSGRVAQLRATGNAIVPQVAAEFVGAYLDMNAPRIEARRDETPSAARRVPRERDGQGPGRPESVLEIKAQEGRA